MRGRFYALPANNLPMYVPILLLFAALLVAPAAALLGVAAGAMFAYRLGRGLSPLPLPSRKGRVITARQEGEQSGKAPPLMGPKVRA